MDQSAKQYYPLGSKTLFMFILKRGAAFLILLPILVVAVVGLDYVPYDYLNISVDVILGYAALLLILLLVVVFVGWLEYVRFGVYVSNEDLRIKRGFLATEEIGIPYRRIRDIKIQRSLVNQLFGVSDIVIILSDFEGAQPLSEESTVRLSFIEKSMAMEIQDGILKKSQVEQINITSAHDDILKKMG